jgi:hypothetical protein
LFEHIQCTSQIDFFRMTKSPQFFNQQKSVLHRKLNDIIMKTKIVKFPWKMV